MTKEECRKLASLAPVLLAYAEGKTIQWKSKITGEWLDVTDLLTNIQNLFTYDLRIKPEPKLRAWKPEEVPVGALVKFANTISIIQSASWNRLYFVNEGSLTYNFLDAGVLHSSKWKWPQEPETAWRACGVETTE